ncbi:hypothetical protein [Pseudomonas sp. REB1044]|uniref:hypothetical protein n=1 Tax=Pseudomonas sp. REB1044 TaxID=2675224 RepID=UPI00315DAC85
MKTIRSRYPHYAAVVSTTLLMLLMSGWARTQTEMPLQASTQANVNSLELYRPRFPDSSSSTVDVEAVDNGVTISFLYKPMTKGDSVGLRWKGTSQWDAQVQTVNTPGQPLRFEVPKHEIVKDVGKTAVVTASVGAGNDPLLISPPFNVSVVRGETPPDKGQEVAARLNGRYNATAHSCPGNLPAYYCNGIIIRSVDNGNFNPWDPSPTAIKLGAVSFSYFRVDSYVNNFYRNAGFIFLPQTEAAAQGKGMEYLCIYAYDAGTIVGTRAAKGCGLKPRTAPATADLSTCAIKNATTVSNWYAFTKTIPNRDFQCSLSTQDAAQFAVSYQVRANRPGNMEALWNEMMVNLWPQNDGANLPIEAFFYKVGNTISLNDAKIFQTKFKNATGKWVPVIALDLNKVSGSPFSYSSANQAVQP